MLAKENPTEASHGGTSALWPEGGNVSGLGLPPAAASNHLLTVGEYMASSRLVFCPASSWVDEPETSEVQ